jgi:hypothetical protein
MKKMINIIGERGLSADFAERQTYSSEKRD